MIKFSFILPCYNVAPYIERCIESIESQDIPQAEYEIICVDDCSKDETAQTIEGCQKQYPNIVLHRHSVNKTAGGARNTGIELAKGKYIWFVDPDDAVQPNVLGKLYAAAEAVKTDTLMFNYQTVLEDGRIDAQKVFDDFPQPLSGPEFLEAHNISIHNVVSVYAGIYSRDFLMKNNLRFPEIKASQDVVFIWESLLASQRYASIADNCYSYIRRDNSTTGNKGKFTAKAILSHCLLFGAELGRILTAFSTEIKPSIKEEIIDTQRSAINRKSRNIIYASPNEKKLFYNSLHEHKSKIEMLKPLMDRKTKNILDFKSLYILWRLRLWGYTWSDKYNHRPQTY